MHNVDERFWGENSKTNFQNIIEHYPGPMEQNVSNKCNLDSKQQSITFVNSIMILCMAIFFRSSSFDLFFWFNPISPGLFKQR